MTAIAMGRVGPDIDAAAQVLGARGRRDAPLGALTTYRVGGRAALAIEAHSLDDLAFAAAAVEAGQLPVLVVGRGSNLLVADAGFFGLAVILGEGLAGLEVDAERACLRAGGAAFLPVVARRTVAAGLTGLEWAVGVPGSIGGAVRMNAGGHGSETSETLVQVGLFELAAGTVEPDAASIVEVQVDQLQLGYRGSNLGATQVVVWADFRLALGDRDASEAKLAEIVWWRRQHQPGGQNAGSVFTNPAGDSAGRLVEEAGLKGLRIGSAAVSAKHANFVQADVGGSADDVMALIEQVRRRVAAETGVTLVTELRLVGFGPP